MLTLNILGCTTCMNRFTLKINILQKYQHNVKCIINILYSQMKEGKNDIFQNKQLCINVWEISQNSPLLPPTSRKLSSVVSLVSKRTVESLEPNSSSLRTEVPKRSFLAGPLLLNGGSDVPQPFIELCINCDLGR